jgi:eukaryotic-like serine/threonine-protein kinase
LGRSTVANLRMADDVFGIVGTVQGGAFRVDAVVAEGGFAVVYRAYHEAFRANVALKCLKVPGTLSKQGQEDFLEKFREEAELLFRLSSAIPSVVRPLHVGTISQENQRFVPFIALEWLEGYTLDHLISTRAIEGAPPLDVRAATKLLTPVADALCRAHEFPTPNGVVSIVHRDLKPENIFIAKVHGRDQTKILDFGIAKAKSAATQLVGQQSAQESPLSAFTPAYGAPEQWVPKRYGQTGPWTDVWGLALTVVEAVCGHCPIDGDHPAMMGSAIDPVRRPTPRNEGVKVTDEVETVFTKALAVDPRERFHNVKDFWNALCRAVSLPETVGKSSQSVPPPAVSSSSSGTVRMDPENRRTDIASSATSIEAPPVPDLVVGSRSSKPVSVKREEPAPLKLDTDRDFGLSPTSVPARRMGTASAYTPRRSEPKLELGTPLTLLVFAVVLMGGDYAYSAVMGEVLRVGPARMFWVAGPLAVLGAVQLMSRLLSHGE